MSQSPIGTLYVEAQKKAAKKPNGHTSSAQCGCSVSVAFFSTNSHRAKFEPCHQHPPRRS